MFQEDEEAFWSFPYVSCLKIKSPELIQLVLTVMVFLPLVPSPQLRLGASDTSFMAPWAFA